MVHMRNIRALLLCILCAATGCAGVTTSGASSLRTEREPMRHEVTRLAKPPAIDADWDKEPWAGIQPMFIDRYMGKKPTHIPTVQAKIAYDDEALYVIFRVVDQYVRAVAQKNQQEVCGDSCVEFFLTPGTDVSKGYFNIEVNCGGTMLCRHQVAPGKDKQALTQDECAGVQIAHSLPRIVDPEIVEPTTWTVEYRLPVALLEKYAAVTRPAPGVVWRANLYKCADLTSHPHWLTWAPIDWPEPNFHVPECFGVLEFR